MTRKKATMKKYSHQKKEQPQYLAYGLKFKYQRRIWGYSAITRKIKESLSEGATATEKNWHFMIP